MSNITQTETEKAGEAIEKLFFSLGINAVSKVWTNSKLGDAVYVTVWNADKSQKSGIETLCAQYQYGKFNGLTNVYKVDNARRDIPQAKYVTVFYKETKTKC